MHKEIEQLLKELQEDIFGFDLRNWRTGITEDEIRKRYEKPEDFPVVSATRYFRYIFPKLKELKVPVEQVIQTMMEVREKNLRQMKQVWLNDIIAGLKLYIKEKRINPDHLQRCYNEYLRYCDILDEKPLTKKQIYKKAKRSLSV